MKWVKMAWFLQSSLSGANKNDMYANNDNDKYLFKTPSHGSRVWVNQCCQTWVNRVGHHFIFLTMMMAIREGIRKQNNFYFCALLPKGNNF